MKFDSQKTYFLAGATGTEIQRRGLTTALPLWSAQVLFDKPELLVDIYRDYIRAGADIVTTNTFRTQRRTLAHAGLESETERINKLAVELAVEAREKEGAKRPVYIAGCITSLEDCYRPDLVPPKEECEKEHGEQIALLAHTPIDFFLLETFNTIAEAEIAADAAFKTGKPLMVSFVAREDGNILNGDSWADALARLKKYAPLAIMVNCVPPAIATRALALLSKEAKKCNIPCGVYANGTGSAGSDEGWDFSSAGSPIEAYVHACDEWRSTGATIIGGCCGTSPEYTKRYTGR